MLVVIAIGKASLPVGIVVPVLRALFATRSRDEASGVFLDALTTLGEPELEGTVAAKLADNVGGVPPVTGRAERKRRVGVSRSTGVLGREVIPILRALLVRIATRASGMR